MTKGHPGPWSLSTDPARATLPKQLTLARSRRSRRNDKEKGRKEKGLERERNSLQGDSGAAIYPGCHQLNWSWRNSAGTRVGWPVN